MWATPPAAPSVVHLSAPTNGENARHCPPVVTPPIPSEQPLPIEAFESPKRIEVATLPLKKPASSPNLRSHGRVGHLDTPYYILFMFLYTVYDKGRLNDRLAHG